MNEPEDTNIPEAPEVPELEETRLEEVAGGLDLCSAAEIQSLTGSLTQSYENVVAFASHVIERVAGSSN